MIKAIIFDWVGTVYKRNTGLFSGTKEMLEKLKPKYKLGLISLAGPGIPRRKQEIADVGIEKYFDSIVVDTKKEKEQFLLCIRELGIQPQEILVVGDRMYREIRVGNLLGCSTLWIRRGDYPQQVPNKGTGEPTKIVETVEDMQEYFLRLL